MKILFIDSYTCAYDTTSYLKQPLGGTQSAVSALSKALAAAGHAVTVINGVSGLVETDGVRFLPLPCPTPMLNEFDVIVPVSAAIAHTLREIGCTRPLVLWSHHAADQPAIQSLADPLEHSLYAGIALVSDWHVKNYVDAFKISTDKVRVMRNAISPGFMHNEPSLRWLKEGKPPVLGYSSTPYRGLDILLLSFSSIRKRMEGATLRIFSSMKIYGDNNTDEFSSLYDLANNLPGVTYVGALSQARLAKEMADIDIWSYPCTFAETSCISAIEAMASGALLVSTDLGALPETTAGFASLTNISAEQLPGRMASAYVDHLVKTATAFKADPHALDKIAHQIAFARANYTWEKRAEEWITWFKQIL